MLRCEIGKFKDAANADECTDCALGKYAAQVNQAACTSCPKGKVTNALKMMAESECKTCLAGKIAEVRRAGRSRWPLALLLALPLPVLVPLLTLRSPIARAGGGAAHLHFLPRGPLRRGGQGRHLRR